MDSYNNRKFFEMDKAKPKRYITVSMVLHALLAFGFLYLTLPITEKISEDKTEEQVVELKYGTDTASEMAADTTTATGLDSATGDAAAVATDTDTRATPTTPTAATASKRVTTTPKPAVETPAQQEELAQIDGQIEEPVEEPVHQEQAYEQAQKPTQESIQESTQELAQEQPIDEPAEQAVEKSTKPVMAVKTSAKVSQQAKIAATEAALEKDVDEALAEQDQIAAAISEQTNKDAELLSKHLQEIQNKKAQDAIAARKAQAEAVAAAVAAENEKQAALAAENKKIAAEKQKAASVAAATAKNAQQQASAAGIGQGNQDGADQVGAGQKGASLVGTPEGVRSIEELRQMPGNPKPNYDLDERLRHEQGMIVFLAYITKEGTPTDFRLVQSTGFRNLDKKTLLALKKWRFYPGQEGWVKLPFNWSLSGGEEEVPTTLRRFGSND